MENPLLKTYGITTQPAAKPATKPKVPPAPTPAQKQKALNQQVKNPPKTIQLGPGLAIPDIQPIPDKMTAYDLKAFGAATGGNKPFHVSEQDWMRRTAYRQSLAGKQAQPQKPQPNPIVDTFNYNQGLVDKSNAETQRALQVQKDWEKLSRTQRKIATTQPITGQEGFTMKSGDRASLERSMAEFDQEVFGGLTYGTRPEGVPEELWMRRTAYRQRLADKFGWDAEVRREQVDKYNRDGLVNGQPSLEQRMEAVKGTFDEVPQWQKALMHTTPLTSLAANKGSFESMVSRVLGEQGMGLADKNNAELYLRSFNQFSPISGSGVSSAYSMLTKDPRAINEMNGYEQVALTGADIAAQIVGAGLTGGASSPGMLKNIGNIATRFLAMDLPGYGQAVQDAGSVEGALKMYGDMIRKGLDPKSGANPAERLNAIAMATAIFVAGGGQLGKLKGKPTPDLPSKPPVLPDSNPFSGLVDDFDEAPTINPDPSVPPGTPDIRGEVGGVGLDAEPTVRGGDQKQGTRVEPQAGTVGKAVWTSGGVDRPIEVVGTWGAKGGREYAKVKGSETGIPFDEITFDSPKSNPILDQVGEFINRPDYQELLTNQSRIQKEMDAVRTRMASTTSGKNRVKAEGELKGLVEERDANYAKISELEKQLDMSDLPPQPKPVIKVRAEGRDVPPAKPPKVEAGTGAEPPVKPPVQKPTAQKPGKQPDIQKPRQADVKQVADAIGLDLTKERKTVPQIAKAVEDGGYVQSAATSAQKALDGKSLNTEEQVGLAMGLNNIKGQIKGLDAALRKAKKEGNDARALEIIKERDDLVSTHKTMLEGLYKARSESGRSLGAGKFFELADYAVKEDVISLAEAKIKGAVPEAKRQQFEADSDRYAAMERELKDAQETIKSARAKEAEYEKKLADAAVQRAPRASRTQGRIPADVAKQALKELGAFEPVVGAVPVFSPKQSKAFSILAKWAIGEVKAGGEVTTDAVVAKMRELVEKNNVGHVLFDEDYYRAIRQALLGDKSGTYSGLLDAADTWLDQRAAMGAQIKAQGQKQAKVQDDWDSAFKKAAQKEEAEARVARRNDIKDAMDATPRNRNAEKMAQGLIKNGSKDFGAIVKAVQAKYKLTDLEAASSARRAVYGLESGLQRRFGKDVMDMSLDVRQKQAELRALKDEIDYNIEKLSPQSIPAGLRVAVRANAFTNVVNRGLDLFYNGLRFTGETAIKPLNSVLETAWMWTLPAHARRTTPKLKFMGTARRAIEAAPAIAQGMWADTKRNWKIGDTALLEKQGFPKVGLNTKNETLNKMVNMFARLPGYTDIPARRAWYEISLLELVDNEVDFMAKQNGWTAAQKMQHRRTLLDNANGELEPMRLAAANAAEELVFANTTKFDQLITKGEKVLSSVIGETGKDLAMLGTDIFVTPYLRIFAKITGYGTDYLYGSLKAAGAAIGSKSKTGGVPPHVRKRVIELTSRQMFGLAIGYAATEWYKEANKSSDGKQALDKIIRLNKDGYVEIPEAVNAGGAMTPFILLIGLKRIEDSGASPSQKDAWRKDLFATLTIETPALTGFADLGRAISLKDDPVRFGAKKIANAAIPGAVRQAAKMMDLEPGSQAWEMRERRINTKPDTSSSTKVGKNGPYTSEKTWAEQDKLKTILNEFRSRVPVERNKFPSKK